MLELIEIVRTQRLKLVASTLSLLRAEVGDRQRFAGMIGARVPENWPPEILEDALPFFVSLMEEHPDWVGWLGWYAIEISAGGNATLVGSIGYKGPPDSSGAIEMGYSVLPQFQRRGYAVEMAAGLIDWARSTRQVRKVLAQTTDDNLGSRGVLSRLGFVPCGPGTDPDSRMYCLDLDNR